MVLIFYHLVLNLSPVILSRLIINFVPALYEHYILSNPRSSLLFADIKVQAVDRYYIT